MADNKSASENQKDPNQQVKLLLIIVLCATVIVPFLATTMAMNTLSHKIAPPGNAEHSSGEAVEGKSEGELVFYEPMEFLVNLADTEVSHYLRTTVSLGSRLVPEEESHAKKGGGGHGGGEEAPQPKLFKKIKSQEPIVRDVIISVISNYPMAALVSAQGKRELKQTINERLQKELETENLAVYFTAFTLQ